LIKRTDSNK